MLMRQHGLENVLTCIEVEHQRYRPTLERCIALLENESGGANIFGADVGGSALPREWYGTAVTQSKYEVYKHRRQSGLTPNGVGPCQLTSAFLQDSADSKGGCWVPAHNMEVGFAFLHTLILQHGVWGGFKAYNGSGPAAVSYANRAVARADMWQRLFS